MPDLIPFYGKEDKNKVHGTDVQFAGRVQERERSFIREYGDGNISPWSRGWHREARWQEFYIRSDQFSYLQQT